jgi:WD40 repeat protein
VVFSPDRKTLAAGTRAGTVWLWNLADPAHPARLGQLPTGPGNNVTSVAFSPDGRILAAGGTGKHVWLWNLADPAHPAPLGQPLTGPGSIVLSVAFSPDGRTLAAGGADDDGWLWNLDVDNAIQRICATTGNTLTRAQWDQYVSSQLPYDPPCAHPGRYGLLVH